MTTRLSLVVNMGEVQVEWEALAYMVGAMIILRIMESMSLDTLKKRKGEGQVSQLSVLRQVYESKK